MPKLICPSCERRHDPGETGIDDSGHATCVDCGEQLHRGGLDA